MDRQSALDELPLQRLQLQTPQAHVISYLHIHEQAQQLQQVQSKTPANGDKRCRERLWCSQKQSSRWQSKSSTSVHEQLKALPLQMPGCSMVINSPEMFLVDLAPCDQLKEDMGRSLSTN